MVWLRETGESRYVANAAALELRTGVVTDIEMSHVLVAQEGSICAGFAACKATRNLKTFAVIVSKAVGRRNEARGRDVRKLRDIFMHGSEYG